MEVRHHRKNSFTYCIVDNDDDNQPENRCDDNKPEGRDDDDKPNFRPVPSSGGEGRLCEEPGPCEGGQLCEGPESCGRGQLCEGPEYLGEEPCTGDGRYPGLGGR